MAEVGKIYWGLQYVNTSQKIENQLILSGQSFSGSTLWDQTNSEIESTPPWYDQSFGIFRVGDEGSGFATDYKVEIWSDIYPITCYNLFGLLQAYRINQGGVANIRCGGYTGLNYLHITNNTINLSRMFNQAYLPDDINDYLINFDTSNVTNMQGMFYSPKTSTLLTTLNLSSFNTSKVTNMGAMFFGCSFLKTLDLSNFNTSNVTNMGSMFYNCINLETLNLSGFNTSKVTKMNLMFYYCQKLTSLDLLDFNTSNVTTMSGMFGSCSSLIILDLSSFDISNVETTETMLSGCSALTTIYAHPNADWNSSTILTTSTGMFTGCTALVGGNGTAHGTSTTANQNDKTRARIDKAGQQGYFTIARRTLSKNITGNGTVTGDGEYDYGTTVDIVVSPDTNYYIDSISKTIGNVESTVMDEDTISSYRFSIELTKNTVIDAVFNYRNEYELTINKVGGDYTIKGAGMYRYLDKPIVVADMNEGLIVFLGWYDPNDLTEPLSKRNPYTFSMPNYNYTIEAHFGDAPFEDLNYRQFILTNGNNELFRLAAKNEKPYLDITDGLGFNKKLTTFKIGLSEKVQYEEINMPSPKGQLYFYEDTNSNIYKKYNDFIRFVMIKPLTLWYKVPIIPDTDMDNTTFHIPVEVTDVGKVDIDQQTNALICPITFYGLGFWKETQLTVDTTGASLDDVYNDGDFECGVNLTLSKEDNSEFTNPEILFKNEDVVYGKCKIGGTYTRIIMNSVNGEESIELYNGDTKIEDAFNYIDFSAAEDNVQFPFPKLQNGVVTTIEFNYDNSTSSDSRSYIAIYDKEYISV